MNFQQKLKYILIYYLYYNNSFHTVFCFTIFQKMPNIFTKEVNKTKHCWKKGKRCKAVVGATYKVALGIIAGSGIVAWSVAGLAFIPLLISFALCSAIMDDDDDY